jgi:tetratricopeptide (TPR) repeat protein
VDARRQLALMLLLATGTSFGCKAMPWSSNSGSPTASAAPSAGQHQYEALSKDFSSGAKSAGVGGPSAPPASDNFLVAGWKKTTGALAAPFSAKTPADSDDPVSLANQPKKVGPAVYISAAQILENQGKFAEAEAKYQAALKASPHDLHTLVGLARCYDRQGKSEKAIETYSKAAKHHPKSSLVQNDLGLCYARQRSTDNAVLHLKKAIELQSDNVRYYNNLATVLVEAGRADEAVQQLSRVNSPAIAHYNVACLLHRQGKVEQSAVHLRLVLAQDQNLHQARELLASMQSMPSHDARVTALPVSMPSPPNVPPAAPYTPQGQFPPSYPTPPGNQPSVSPIGYGVPAPRQESSPGEYPVQSSFSPWR